MTHLVTIPRNVLAAAFTPVNKYAIHTQVCGVHLERTESGVFYAVGSNGVVMGAFETSIATSERPGPWTVLLDYEAVKGALATKADPCVLTEDAVVKDAPRYPDWRRLVPRNVVPATTQLNFDVAFLALAAKAMGAFDKTKPSLMNRGGTLRQLQPNPGAIGGPVGVWQGKTDKAIVVVGPLRVDVEELPALFRPRMPLDSVQKI